jgi:hypothetical protein
LVLEGLPLLPILEMQEKVHFLDHLQPLQVQVPVLRLKEAAEVAQEVGKMVVLCLLQLPVVLLYQEWGITGEAVMEMLLIFLLQLPEVEVEQAALAAMA